VTAPCARRGGRTWRWGSSSPALAVQEQRGREEPPELALPPEPPHPALPPAW
jgi:hypothetical protein